MTLYSSGEFYELAGRAALRSTTEPKEALVAVVLSALAQEAFFNDFIDLVEVVHNPPGLRELQEAAALARELELAKAQLPAKIRTIYLILTHNFLADGAPIFQDLSLLVRLRNVLVHKRPESIPLPLGQPEPKNATLVEQLVSRKLVAQPLRRDIPLLSRHLSSPDVAKWACRTAKRTGLFLIDALPECNARTEMEHFCRPFLEE